MPSPLASESFRPKLIRLCLMGAIGFIAAAAAVFSMHRVAQADARPAMIADSARSITQAQATSPSSPELESTLIITINVDSTFARQTPNWDSGLVGRLMKWDRFTAVGRSADGQWLQIDYGNSLVWIHLTMARFPQDLEGLNNPLVLALPVTEQSGNVSPSRIAMAPTGVPAISLRARQLYRAAVASGRDPHMVTVAGDCNSEPPVYLGRFAAGGFNLQANGFGKLQSVAKRFAQSFAHTSLAVDGGHNAASVIDPLFTKGEQCSADENPVQCELRTSNASILIVSLGTGDTFTWGDFEANYRRVIDTAIQAKVLPVLVTKADKLETVQGGAAPDTINNIIRRLGREYQVPVIDFALAAKRLPGQGLADEAREIEGQGVVYLTDDRFHLNGYGMDMKTLLTLLTLSAISGR